MTIQDGWTGLIHIREDAGSECMTDGDNDTLAISGIRGTRDLLSSSSLQLRAAKLFSSSAHGRAVDTLARVRVIYRSTMSDRHRVAAQLRNLVSAISPFDPPPCKAAHSHT